MRPNNPTRALPIASPANMLPVQVIRREEIAPDVVSVLIVLPGTEQAPAPYLPGQFVTLALPTPRETLYRSYSLCGDGDAQRPWELTIKRMRQGAVSTYFYQSVYEDTLLYASLPRGTFTLPARIDPELVLVMIAMGSGITPIMGMLRALARMPDEERPLVQLHYASKAPRDVIFGDELFDMDPDQVWLRQRHYFSSRGHRMTVEAILTDVGTMARKAHWYVCGADTLKAELHQRLSRLRVPERQIHSEVFATQAAGPAYRVAEGAKTGGSLRIIETGASLDVEPNETVLAALERHGYHPAFSCRVGACGTCRLRMTEGQVDSAGEALSAAERADGYLLSCLARPIGEVVLVSGGRPPAGVARVAAVTGAPIGRPRTGVALTRFASLASAGMLLLGVWNLTDHRPYSWGGVAAAAPAAPTAQTAQATAVDTTTTSTPAPGATHTTSGGTGQKPTPTTSAGSGGGPAPTPTSSAGSGGGPPPTPTATATPKPTPTCHSTPSKPC
jgi:ring-1,2-phenylacetyl-CoA epoxidase subunit PaaE